MSRLAGKVALVLGAGGAGNMGQAIARRFAAEGAIVVISGRSMASLDALAQELGALAVECDITVRPSLQALADRVVGVHGRIDVAVNCVGLNLSVPFLETSDEDLARLYAVQFKGPFQFMQVMVEAMVQGGSIIQISSAAGTVLLDDYAAYRGTKAGIDQVVRSVADEFGARGIRANSISPGAVRTPMTEGLWQAPAAVAEFAATSPLGRIGTVEDIAAAALFLAEDACFMTGENLHVSGGLLLRKNPTKADILRAMAQPSPQ